MIKLTIDGVEIEVEQGATVIQAADLAGIDIPRYCYHPGLPIVGVCRICLVEIERMPKLQVACYTAVSDGMVVHTNSPQVLEARQAVMEFLLVNHPLDCPVCDQAGECWLQNFYMQHALHDSQMIENKVKKSKARPIGPNVMLDSERCILCTRCVRFCDEISQTNELGIFNRGDHAELLPYPGRELDNNYSGNAIDICPVGALTDRDFRFRTRVWYLAETPSVCPGCSMGCNINVHHNDNRTYKADGARISRVKPRYNADVNQWWMCDAGRYGFTHVDDETRILSPLRKSNDAFSNILWDQAIDDIVAKMQGIIDKHGTEAIGVILSPQMTNEDLFAAKQLFVEQLGLKNIDYEVAPSQPGNKDDFLIKADKNPNSRGAQDLHIDPQSTNGMSVAEMLKAAANGKLKALFVFCHDLGNGFSADDVKGAFSKLDFSVFQGSNHNNTSKLADYILPSVTFVEQDGTFTNYSGRIQKINQAVEPLGDSKPNWTILKMFAKRFGKSMPYFETGDVFNALSASVPAFRSFDFNNSQNQNEQITTEVA